MASCRSHARRPSGICLLAVLWAGSAPRSSDASATASPAIVHVVEAGQTLWSIAHSYGVGVDRLLKLNGIVDPTAVFSGQELLIPSPRREPVPAVAEGAGESLGLAWPLRGRLTSLYGRRGRGLHSGLDIAATPGTIITASAPGKVVRANRSWGRYGKVVLVEHRDGYVTLYAHASRCFVREGEQVRRGQAIAAVGRTGNATGPHLHFELWSGDRTVDPLRYLQIPADRRTALFSR